MRDNPAADATYRERIIAQQRTAVALAIAAQATAIADGTASGTPYEATAALKANVAILETWSRTPVP
jgi:hypothetical protein